MTFMQGFDVLRKARPGFDLTRDQAMLWNAMLADIPPQAVFQGAAKLGAEYEFAYNIAAWRNAALTFVKGDVAGTHDQAWADLQRNRRIEMQLVYEQREDVAVGKRKAIRWSSEASRRAAEYVSWADPNWEADAMNMIRSQHRGAYQAIVEKQGLVDAANDVRNLGPGVQKTIGNGPNLLGPGGV